MDLVRDIERSGNNYHHLNFRGIHVPFPEFDNDDGGPEHRHQEPQQLSQPSDSEAGDSSTYQKSSSSRTTTITTTATMQSSTSSTTLSESLQGESCRDDVTHQPLLPAACCHGDEAADSKLPPSETSRFPSRTPLRRISCQDEMLSIDMSSVADPVSCIKRILDGLVCELKEQSNGSGQQQQKKADGLPLEKQGVAKRARTAPEKHQGETSLNHEDQQDATGDSKPESSSTADKQQQQSIQTIINWMDTFQDSEPVQLACLQSLPSLLEHNTLRYHAQMEGLATIVLYNMAAFQENFLLQLTAFHTLVVLLRPLGAMEGTLVRTAGINGRGVVDGIDTSNGAKGTRRLTTKDGECLSNRNVDQVSKNQANASTEPSSSPLPDSPLMSAPASLPLWEENGVRVMLDVLRLYSHDRYLQAMGCWAMVNAALYPNLKKSLLRLGGVYVVTNAMMLHPSAEAVQFRGLFALINLVIPDADADANSIHCHVYQIARLTILAMKNFHTNKSILNRGCLVLRNLSLTRSHVTILARTPGCIDMLLHCRQACPKDLLVQRSARTIMILMQRVTDRKIMWSGANTGPSSDVPAEGSGLGEASPTADAGSLASAPCAPRKEECGKRSRSSCSW